MNQQLSPDAMRLRAVRASIAAIEPGEWTNVHDATGYFIEARGPMGELMPVCRFDAMATPDEMGFVTDAPATVRFLLRLLDRAWARLREVDPALRERRHQRDEPRGEPQAGPKDFAAEASMKCSEPAFLAFLEEVHGLERPLTPDRAAQKLRSICGVTSRKELNEGGRAADAWRALRDDFQAWKRRA